MKRTPAAIDRVRGVLLPAIAVAAAGLLGAAEPPIERLDPPELGFYSRRLDAGGIAIKAHADVSDEAMRAAAARVNRSLGNLPVVRSNLVAAGAEIHIIGRNQKMVDLPEYRHWRDRPFEGKLMLDQRARGLGGIVSSCGEDNLLALPSDAFHDHRDICTHEFSHTIHEHGMSSNLVAAVAARHRAALAEGRWATTYAAQNEKEFFAELSMWYWDSRGDFGKLDPPPRVGRAWLREYDPESFRLLDDFYSGRLDARPIERVKIVPGPASDEGRLRSAATDRLLGAILHNRTAGTMKVYWLDFDGRRKFFDILHPGSVQSLATFAGHSWLLTDEQDRGLFTFVMGEKPATLVFDPAPAVIR